MQILSRTAALAVVAGSLALAAAAPASAQVARPLGTQVAVPADSAATPVQWRGRGHYRGGYYRGGYYRGGGGWGWGGVGAGLAAGALLGAGIAAASRPYYGPGYYAPPPAAYGAVPAGDPVAYCMSRFRSYDPASGTYLGYDGYRHPCP